MEINDTTPLVNYVAAAGQTVFAIPFNFFANDNIKVERNGFLLTQSLTPTSVTQYSLSGAGSNSGGAITLGAGASLNDKIIIYREIPIERTQELLSSGPFQVGSLNTELATLVAIQQELSRESSRGAKVPIGEQGVQLPSSAERVGKFLAFDAGGNPISASGTGPDSGLRSDLGSSTGARLSGFASQIPSAPAVIDVETMGSRRADLRDWAGVDLSGSNESTAQMQDAATQTTAAGVKLEVPAGRIVLTSPVEVPAGAVIEGTTGAYQFPTRSGRTVVHFAHPGYGFTSTGTVTFGGRVFRHLATLRDQPAPAPGWAPAANDWDFFCSGATDMWFEDILLINPTKGIVQANGGGRFTFNRVWGQPLQVGIQIENALDVMRAHQLHFWNFWSANKANEIDVWKYTTQNATAFYSQRNDNPDLESLFFIFYRHNLRIGNFAPLGNTTTQRMRVFGLGADACGSAITIDPDVNGATVDVYGFYGVAYEDGGTGGSLINIEGTNSDIRIYGRTDLIKADHNAIRITGPGSALTVNDLIVQGYNQANGGHAAVWVDPAAFGLNVRGDTFISGGVGGAAQYAGGGRINTRAWRAYVPSVAPSSGSFGAAATINSAVFNIQDSVCTVIADVSIPDNGTGSGSVLLGLPITSAAGVFAVGMGNEVALFGKTLRVQVPDNATTCGILNYDNTYPAANGARIVVQFSYRVA
jgi:hypothetical protein